MKDQITIVARRWFQKTGGNTYHSCEVYVNGEMVGRAPYTYGYGEHYLQTALEIMQNAGVREKTDRRANGMGEDYLDFRDDMRDHRDKFVVTCTDVTRKRDL